MQSLKFIISIVWVTVCLLVVKCDEIDDKVAVLLTGDDLDETILFIENLPHEKLISHQISLARTYAQNKDVPKALKTLQEHIEDAPTDIAGYVALSKLYIHLKEYSQSLAIVQRGLAIEDSDNMLMVLACKSLLNKAEAEDTAAATRGAVDHSTRKEERKIIVDFIDRIEASCQNKDKAEEDEHVEYELGMLLFSIHEHKRGRSAFQRAASINPKLDKKIIGKIYSHYGNHEWAAREYQPLVWQFIVDTEALGDSNQRSERDTRDFEAVLLQAQTKELLNDGKSAMELYELVLKYDPYNSQAHGSMGLLLLGTGLRNNAAVEACGVHVSDAMYHLNHALRGDPKNMLYRNTIQYCNNEQRTSQTWKQLLARDTKRITHERRVQKQKESQVSRFIEKIKKMLITLLEKIGVHVPLKDPREIALKKQRTMKNKWITRQMEIPSVDRVAIQSAQELLDKYVSQNKPVIITNLQSTWDKRKMTKEYLSRQYGGARVKVSISETNRFDGPEDGTLWGLDGNQTVLVRPPMTTMLMQDYFQLTDNSMSDVKQIETFYLEYLSLQQYLGANFTEDVVPTPPILQELKTRHIDKVNAISEEAAQAVPTGLDFLVSNLWISNGKNTISPLHYDDYENFLFQIIGEKEVTLFPPSDFDKLYYDGRPKGSLLYGYPGNFSRLPQRVDNRSFVFGSGVNIDKPDLNKHPKFAHATAIRAHIQAGDTLFLPSYWHHEVQSLPCESTNMNMAINIWFANVTASPFLE